MIGGVPPTNKEKVVFSGEKRQRGLKGCAESLAGSAKVKALVHVSLGRAHKARRIKRIVCQSVRPCLGRKVEGRGGGGGAVCASILTYDRNGSKL